MFFLVDLDKAIFNNHCISAINTSIISKYYVLRETDFSAEKLFSGGSDSDGRDDNVNGALGKCARKLGKALLLADNLICFLHLIKLFQALSPVFLISISSLQ